MPLLVAPFIGSFLGVLIHRLPRHLPLLLARSGCEACGTRLAPLDLVPLVSYAFQRGRCRYCHHPIGWFHPVIELAALCVAACAVLECDTPQDTWIACSLGWMLLALGWIDVEWFLLPDVLTIPLLLSGLGVTILTVPVDIFGHALGAVCGYLGLRSIALLYRAVRGRDGLGVGDAKLLAAAIGPVAGRACRTCVCSHCRRHGPHDAGDHRVAIRRIPRRVDLACVAVRSDVAAAVKS
jgi:leader peptidase (prepilin peptidase)/N-methyltransferase